MGRLVFTYENTQVQMVETPLVTCYSRDGKLFLMVDNDDEWSACVFGIDGRLVAERVFCCMGEMALPAGYYIVVLESAGGIPPTRLRTYVK